VSNPGVSSVYVRYRLAGLAIDDFRLSVESAAAPGACPLKISHLWREKGLVRSATRTVPPGTLQMDYSVETTPGSVISNEAIILECPAAVTP
jgi:hypothetical protein